MSFVYNAPKIVIIKNGYFGKKERNKQTNKDLLLMQNKETDHDVMKEKKQANKQTVDTWV